MLNSHQFYKHEEVRRFHNTFFDKKCQTNTKVTVRVSSTQGGGGTWGARMDHIRWTEPSWTHDVQLGSVTMVRRVPPTVRPRTWQSNFHLLLLLLLLHYVCIKRHSPVLVFAVQSLNTYNTIVIPLCSTAWHTQTGTSLNTAYLNLDLKGMPNLNPEPNSDSAPILIKIQTKVQTTKCPFNLAKAA